MLRRTELGEALRALGRASRPLRGGRLLGLVLALVLSTCLAACGTDGAGSEQAANASRESSGASQPAGHDDGIPRSLLTDFPLLSTPADGIPPDIRSILKVPVPGMKWSLARLIPVSLPGTYWLVPGVGHVCIVATSPGSAAVGTVCASVGQALRHGVANTSLDQGSGNRTIVGVAPAGTRAVLVRSGGSTTSVRVHRGTFVLRDSVLLPPNQLTLRQGRGQIGAH